MSEKPEKPINIAVSTKTHARLEKLGAKNQTFDDILVALLGETELLPKLESALREGSEKLQLGKERGSSSLLSEAGSILERALEIFVKAVKTR